MRRKEHLVSGTGMYHVTLRCQVRTDRVLCVIHTSYVDWETRTDSMEPRVRRASVTSDLNIFVYTTAVPTLSPLSGA